MGLGDARGGCGWSSRKVGSEEEELGALGSNAAVSAGIAESSAAAASRLMWNFGIISRPGWEDAMEWLAEPWRRSQWSNW
jgi:hypothetical protein